MADGDSRHRTRNAAVLDVQVTAADARKSNSHNGILGILQLWLRLIHKLKTTFLYVCIRFHLNDSHGDHTPHHYP